MNDENIKAKEIFFKYRGSHFYMAREENYEEYKKYKISKEQERDWILEYQNNLIFQLKGEVSNNYEFATLINNFIETSLIYSNNAIFINFCERICEKINQLDSYSKVLVLEKILGYLWENILQDSLVQELILIKNKLIDYLRAINDSPITVDQYYIQKYSAVSDFSESAIRERVSEDIEKYTKIRI